MAVGLSEWSLLTLATGLAGGLHGPWLPVAASVVAAVWAVWKWSQRRTTGMEKDEAPSRPDQRWGAHSTQREAGPDDAWLARHGLWLALPFLLLIVAGAMLPPWDFDVREYHLQVPKEWHEAGRIGFLPHNVYGNMPLGAELHALLAMVFMPGARDWWWGALAGKTVIACFAPLAALGLFAAGRRFDSPRAGLVAALVYLSLPWVVHVSQAGLVEGAVACYLVLAVYATAIWAGEDAALVEDADTSPTRQRAWRLVPSLARRARIVAAPRGPLLLAGFLAGSAAACKYPALLLVVAPLTLAALFARGRFNWRPAALFLLAALCGCGLWYAKNAALTGNPVYPLVLGGATRTPERMAQWNRAHRVPPDELGRRYSAAQAYTAAADLGWRNLWQSPLLVPLAAAAFFDVRRRRFVLWLAAYAGFYLAVWWLATHRVDRFWVPVLPVLALLAGVGAAGSASRVWRTAVTVLLLGGLAANLLFLLSAGVYDHRYLVSLEQLRRDEPAEPNGPSRVHPIHRYLNDRASAGDRVLLVGDAQPFDLELPALYSTCFDECLFERLMKGRTAAQRRAALRGQQITYVLVNWRELGRYRSPGNYGFTDYVTKKLVREELVRDQQVLRPVRLGVAAEQAELFHVVE
jgi:4-amino-4-deoxy-L-arabinose transferase-like glycosyltransferase